MPGLPRVEIINRQISEALSPFGIFPTENQLHSIREYVILLLKWNRLIGLTSIEDPVEIVARHFGESMYAVSLLPVENCRLADVGSGAGFPGLAIKIACPGIQIMLIESNKKKCAFLSEVVRSLGFNGVEIRHERFENIRPETVHANVITSRAVGGFTELVRWAKNALVHRGHLVLWVGGEDATKIARIPGWTWQPAARIPDSQRRFILIGRPVSEPAQHG
jgi:16S rRNA (guanine527-N7)-methyltransferase